MDKEKNVGHNDTDRNAQIIKERQTQQFVKEE